MLIYWCKKFFFFLVKNVSLVLRVVKVMRVSAKNDKTANSRFIDLRSLRYKGYKIHQKSI